MKPSVTLIIILVVANTPIYLIVGRTFFGGWQGFVEALRFWFTPDILSAFRGEYYEDRWQRMKLAVFAAMCAGLIVAEYATIHSVCSKR
jgi:hypothetical protein